MGQKHPYSGLTDQKETMLLRAGWSELDAESLPPPWTDPERAKSYTPEEAYAECVRRMKQTMETPR